MILSVYAANDGLLSDSRWQEYVRRLEVISFFRGAIRFSGGADRAQAHVWVIDDLAAQDYEELLTRLEETAQEFGQKCPRVIGGRHRKERRMP